MKQCGSTGFLSHTGKPHGRGTGTVSKEIQWEIFRGGKFSWSDLVEELLSTTCLAETVNQPIYTPIEMSLAFTSAWPGASPLVPGELLQSLSQPVQIQLEIVNRAKTSQGRKRKTKCHTSNTAEELLKRQLFLHPSQAATLLSSLCIVLQIFCNSRSAVTKMYFQSHLHALLRHNGTFK